MGRPSEVRCHDVTRRTPMGLVFNGIDEGDL